MKNKKSAKAVAAAMALFFTQIRVSAATGNYIADSQIGQGLLNMLKDLGFFGMIAGAAFSLISTIILLIKKSAANANDTNAGKAYNSSIIVNLAIGVGVFLVGALMNIIGSYFGVNVSV